MTRLTLAALLLAACTALPSSPDPGTPGLIGQGRVGAPYGVSSAPDLPPGRRSDGPARRTTPSPAVANVATSEGPSPAPVAGTDAGMSDIDLHGAGDEPANHRVSRQGDISHMGPGYPKSYLALPCKHGNVRCHLTVELCGPADCVVMRQTDYGPSQRVHPDRIADVSIAVFERICGVPARFGLCPGSWTAVTHDALPTLPATDTRRSQ